jgi:hypothetical protein
LLQKEKFAELREAKESPIAVKIDCTQYLQERLFLQNYGIIDGS